MSARETGLDCLREDTLLAMIDGALGADERSVIEEHLGGCESCLQLLAVLTNPTEGPPTPPSRPRPSSELATAGLLSRYQVTEAIGTGGMGIVYSGWDPELGRPVALKLLRAELSERSDGTSRVLREAQAMARLKHPNVVAIYDVGTWNERVFIAMELVEGGTLRKWLTAAPRGWREIVEVFLHAGRGLAAAHAAGLVHRDFKPDNVLVGSDGRVLVTDFGLARLAENPKAQAEAGAHATLLSAETPRGPISGSSMMPFGGAAGTPGYMSPEQMRGQRADARTDLFAFSTALYESVAGQRPYPGDDFVLIRARTESGELAPPLKKIPRWLYRELERGLQPDPTRRHRSINELLAALERGLRSERWPRSTKSLLALLAVLIFLTIGFLAADRTGLLQRLRRLTPGERRVTGLIEHARDELRTHGRAAAADVYRQAELAAPGNPRVLLGFGETLVELAANAQANEKLSEAFLRRDELLEIERARLDILRLQTQGKGKESLEQARAAWQKWPRDFQIGILYARALGGGGRFTDELPVLDEMHRLPATPGSVEQIDLAESAVAQSAGDLPRALAAARRALAAYQAHGDPLGIARARLRETGTLARQGADPALVRRGYQDAIALARSVDDSADVALAETSLGSALTLSGELSAAQAAFEDALAIFKATESQLNEGIVLLNLSGVLRRERDLPDAIERLTEAQSIFLEVGDRRNASRALVGLGDMRLELGDLSGGAAALEKALEFQRETKEPGALLDALIGLGCVRLEQGDLEEARKLLEETRANSAHASKQSLVSISWQAAAIDFAAGKFSSAETHARDALQLAHDAAFVDEEAEEQAQLARILLEEGRLPEAREAVTRGQALLEKTKSGVARGELLIANGRLLAKEDPHHLNRAQAAISAALEASLHGGVAVDQWEARLASAETNSAVEDRRAALSALSRQAGAQGFGLYARYADDALARQK